MGRVGGRLVDLDAVTLDAFGTLIELREPIAKLRALLPEYDADAIGSAFHTEAAYYVAHSHEGRDAATLADLHSRCTAVFNDALGSALSAKQYLSIFEYVFVPGAVESVARLRACGLSLAVVANFDVSLHDHLAPLRLPVITSAETGTPKPDARIFHHALDGLGVRPERALHIGDTPETDAEGAAAAGMQFAPAPITEALAAWS